MAKRKRIIGAQTVWQFEGRTYKSRDKFLDEAAKWVSFRAELTVARARGHGSTAYTNAKWARTPLGEHIDRYVYYGTRTMYDRARSRISKLYP